MSLTFGNWWSAQIVDNNAWIHFTCENKGTTNVGAAQRSDDGSKTFLSQAQSGASKNLSAISGSAPTQSPSGDLASLLKLDSGVSKNLGVLIPAESADKWLTHGCYGFFWGITDNYMKFKGNDQIQWNAGFRVKNGKNILSSGEGTIASYTVVEAALALSASAAALYGMSSLTF